MNESMNDELFWTAVQYAAGDLGDEAAVEFEQRLETDQTAREALAEAVALSEAVAQAEAVVRAERVPVAPAGVERRRGTAVIAGIALVTAACLALVFVARSDRGGNVAEAPLGDMQLAAAWVEGHDVAVVATVDEALLLAQADDDEYELPPMNLAPSAPDWLIAAVVDAQSSATRGEN